MLLSTRFSEARADCGQNMKDGLCAPLQLTEFCSFLAIAFFKAATSFQDSRSRKRPLALGVYLLD